MHTCVQKNSLIWTWLPIFSSTLTGMFFITIWRVLIFVEFLCNWLAVLDVFITSWILYFDHKLILSPLWSFRVSGIVLFITCWLIIIVLGWVGNRFEVSFICFTSILLHLFDELVLSPIWSKPVSGIIYFILFRLILFVVG